MLEHSLRAMCSFRYHLSSLLHAYTITPHQIGLSSKYCKYIQLGTVSSYSSTTLYLEDLCIQHDQYSFSFRFGSGFTLQAKVKLSAPTEPEVIPQSPKTSSFRRPVSPLRSLGSSSPDSLTVTPLGGGGTFNPYDTTSLHIFIREAFHEAVLLEEHQVCSGTM